MSYIVRRFNTSKFWLRIAPHFIVSVFGCLSLPFWCSDMEKPHKHWVYAVYDGGSGGIRTHEPVRTT